MKFKALSFLLIFFSFYNELFAQQETVITGKVLEKGKPEPIPFVNIGFKGTSVGITSDFEGNFTLRTTEAVDSIIVSYIGYKTVRRVIKPGEYQYITIELSEQTNDLREVVVRPGENPALRIIRKAQEMRDRNDQQTLRSYEYDSYVKMDISMDNISDKMKNSKLFSPIKDLFDTANQMKNEDGKYILPILISETHSRIYQNNNPSLSKEMIKANSLTGFGVEQGSYLMDLLGASLLQFNFNQNWIRILAKDFISPIASGSNSYYIYTLLDSMYIDGYKCYQIRLNLRREEDLGFLGNMWITDSSFAIKQIQVEIAPSANVNFIDKLKIQQEMMQTPAGPWIPSKTRLIIDMAELGEKTNGFLAKMYRANRNIEVNNPKPPEFFDVQIEREYESTEKDSDYWKNVRPEPFSKTEKQMFSMIDSVKNLPAVKTYLDIIRLVIGGHYRAGKFDIGPYLFLFGYNQVEQLRMRLGFRTNLFFSKKWVLRPYIAYGFGDAKFKYGLGVDYVFSRKKWCIGSFQFRDDYSILGVTDVNEYNTLQVNSSASNLFAVASFGSSQARMNHAIDYQLNFIRQINRDWTYRLGFQNTYFEPAGNFIFAYVKSPTRRSANEILSESFTYSAATVEVRYAYKEYMVIRGSQRIRMTMPKAPAFTFTYTRGIRGLLNSDFDYDRLQLNISQHIATGIFGNADFSITGGKVFGRLPYPMLDVPRGNPTFIYSDKNYSLMNLYEFVADEYLQLSYIQHFEGLFFNRIPLLKKWKLRNFAFIKTAYGHLNSRNRLFLPPVNAEGQQLSPIYTFRHDPYAETGLGIENIFRFLSVSVVKRLTYLNNANIRHWGINAGLSITF